MSRNAQHERRVCLGLGVIAFLVVFTVALWVGLVGTDGSNSRPGAAFVVGGATILGLGIVFIVAGLREQVSVAGRTLEWWQLRSVGALIAGHYVLTGQLRRLFLGSDFEFSGFVLGLTIVGLGAQQLRNGRPEETGSSFRHVATVVFGTMAVFLLLTVLLIWSS